LDLLPWGFGVDTLGISWKSRVGHVVRTAPCLATCAAREGDFRVWYFVAVA